MLISLSSGKQSMPGAPLHPRYRRFTSSNLRSALIAGWTTHREELRLLAGNGSSRDTTHAVSLKGPVMYYGKQPVVYMRPLISEKEYRQRQTAFCKIPTKYDVIFAHAAAPAYTQGWVLNRRWVQYVAHSPCVNTVRSVVSSLEGKGWSFIPAPTARATVPTTIAYEHKQIEKLLTGKYKRARTEKSQLKWITEAAYRRARLTNYCTSYGLAVPTFSPEAETLLFAWQVCHKLDPETPEVLSV